MEEKKETTLKLNDLESKHEKFQQENNALKNNYENFISRISLDVKKISTHTKATIA